MLTKSEIETKLRESAEGLKLQGKVVDTLISWMREVVSFDVTNSLILAMEASASRCTELNSAITHARDKMYSVYRGINQHWLITNIKVTESKTVKIYDVCGKINGLYLLFAKDYTFTADSTLQELELIVSEKEAIEEKFIANDDNKYYVSTESTGLSQESYLEINGEHVQLTNNFSEALGDDSKLFDWTNVDFGISVVNPNGFTNADELVLRVVPYTDKVLVESDIVKLPGFNWLQPEFNVITTVEKLYTDDNTHWYRNYIDYTLSGLEENPENLQEYKRAATETPILMEYSEIIRTYYYDDPTEGKIEVYSADGRTFFTSPDLDPSTRITGWDFYSEDEQKIIYSADGKNFYTEKSLDPSTIYIIQPTDNFIFKSEIPAVVRYERTTTTKTEKTKGSKANLYVVNAAPESSISEILIKSNTGFLSGFVVKSKQDLDLITLSYSGFGGRIKNVRTIITRDEITIYYVLADNDPVTYISDREANAFYSYLRTAYYITQTVTLIKASNFIPDTDLFIKIEYRDVPNESELNAVVEDYCSAIAGKPVTNASTGVTTYDHVFDLYELLSRIQRLDWVSFASVPLGSGDKQVPSLTPALVEPDLHEGYRFSSAYLKERIYYDASKIE